MNSGDLTKSERAFRRDFPSPATRKGREEAFQAECARKAPQIMITLELELFAANNNEKMLRTVREDQRHLFRHLIGGPVPCCYADREGEIKQLADAHGWNVDIIVEGDEGP